MTGVIQLLDWGYREVAPVGAWIRADYSLASGTPVYQVRELVIDELFLPELDEFGRLQPEKRRYLEPYTSMAMQGGTPPSIVVIEMENGRQRVVDGHRRSLSLKAAGFAKVRALVSPLVDMDGERREATEEWLKSLGQQVVGRVFMPSKQSVFDFTFPSLEDSNVIREAKVGDTTITLNMSGRSREAEVASVRTPQAKRRKGSARNAMVRLITEADAAGVSLKLGASPLDARTNLVRLIRFYESAGFRQTGRAINPRGEPEMVRLPGARSPILDFAPLQVEVPEPNNSPSHSGVAAPDVIDVGGVGRPRLNSMGLPIAGTDDAIRNFWAWFGDSKTVDAQGRPIVVLHGTALEGLNQSTDIASFDRGMVGNRFSSDDRGFFFTSFPAFADTYARSDADYRNPGAGQGVVYPVYVKAGNPLVIDAAFLKKEGMSPIGQDEDTITFWGVYQGLILQDWYNPRKHDSIVLVDSAHSSQGVPTQTVVAFKPEQIKSAIGNSGSFRPGSKLLHDHTDETIAQAFNRKSAQPLLVSPEAATPNAQEKGGPKQWEKEAKDLALAIRRRSDADRAAGLEQISDETLLANRADSRRISELMRKVEEAKAVPVVAVPPTNDAAYEAGTGKQRAMLDRFAPWDGAYGFSLRNTSESLNQAAQASFTEYAVASGVRKVYFSDLGELSGYDDKAERDRIARLAKEITRTGEIEPIFVAIDPSGEPWIIEGQHRARALRLLGYQSIPARVVLDTSTPTLDLIEVDGVLRPVQNALGQPIHPTQEGVQNFWRWFKDSQMVDDHGRPFVSFHGTKSDVGAFDLGRAGLSDPGLLGPAIYFTPHQDQASRFAQGEMYGKGDAPNVVPAYLSAANPVRIRDGVLPDGRALSDLHPKGISVRTASAARKNLMGLGYDGAIFEVAGEVSQLVVFEPGQVKSSLGNSGAFDPMSGSLVDAARAPVEEQTIDVDGVERSVMNAAGQRIHSTEDGIRNFWRWFGDAEMVDDRGRPEVVFHGTHGEFDAFNETRSATFVSRDAGWVAKFMRRDDGNFDDGASVMPVYLRAKKIFDFENKRHVSALATKASLGATGVAAIREGKWGRLEDRSTMAAIKALGFDAAFVKEDGVKNIAIFTPSILKSVTGNSGRFAPDALSLTDAADAPTQSPINMQGVEVDGVIRSTANSEGQLIHPTEEGIRNFWRWFGDSKVVDALGRPLVIYHGTRAGEFDEFKPNIRKGEQLGFGVHFATEKSFADKYASDDMIARKGKSPQVYAVYVNGRNPLIADSVVTEGSLEFSLAKKLAGNKLFTIRDENGKMTAYMQNAIDATSAQRAEAVIREAGFDVIRYQSRIGSQGVGARITAKGESWIAFTPTQIKSVTGNSGRFDPNNPSLTDATPAPTEKQAATQDEEPMTRILVDGVLRSTINSAGQPLGHDTKEVVDFWRWFGDSKAVDSMGRPVRVFHGTDAEFAEFDYSRIKSFNEGIGFYFTDNPNIAAGYGKLKAGYLSIKKPLDYSEPNFSQGSLITILDTLARAESKRLGEPIEDGFLSNFADVRTDGLKKTLTIAAEALSTNETANDTICELFNRGVNPESLLEAVRLVTGHDSIASNGFSNLEAGNNRISIAWFNDQVRIKEAQPDPLPEHVQKAAAVLENAGLDVRVDQFASETHPRLSVFANKGDPTISWEAGPPPGVAFIENPANWLSIYPCDKSGHPCEDQATVYQFVEQLTGDASLQQEAAANLAQAEATAAAATEIRPGRAPQATVRKSGGPRAP